MYKFLIRPILFLLDAEKAHHITTRFLKKFLKLPLAKTFIRKIYSIQDVRLEREVFGLKFKNPVGLAAGFDKDAKYIEEFACFGFGFIEIGTVTPKAQNGNPKPRLFRLSGDQALINRMGFNNDGAEAVAKRLKENSKSEIPACAEASAGRRNSKSETGNSILIGGNIGKNALTPNEDAISDYETCFEVLFDVVDYFVVNVSSPNTPGLRALQEKKPLTELLRRLKEKNISMCQV
ncbi:MAG: dihydroorotate dehydrogenase (quinone), partial [Bacteroidetes bacterium]|nr:dihydroorotate dehydrogenase (quinone) [Bacteroidota bacterium]